MNYKPLATSEVEKTIIGIWGYCHYDDEIKILITSFINAITNESELITIPDRIVSENTKILWAMLVYVYGDYGVSPEFGFIEAPYFQDVIDVLQDIYNA